MFGVTSNTMGVGGPSGCDAGGGGGEAVQLPGVQRPQSRKSTVTSKDMALASSIVSSRVFES